MLYCRGVVYNATQKRIESNPRPFQGDGTAAAEGDPQSGDVVTWLAGRYSLGPAPGLGGLVHGKLLLVLGWCGNPWFFFTAASGFSRRSQYASQKF